MVIALALAVALSGCAPIAREIIDGASRVGCQKANCLW